MQKNFRVSTLFHPKLPILISQHPNMFPKIVYRFMNSKGLSKTPQTWNRISFQHNSTHFYKNPQQQLNSYHKSEIMNTQGMNHQQQYLITTTTSIKHDFINNLSTTIHSSTFMGKTQIYMYIHLKHVKFNINNLIIFKFIYPNSTSKHKHEFHQWKSNNHFSQLSTYA